MKFKFIVFMYILSVCMQAKGQNPILPLWEHVADGEPYVFEDPDCPGTYRVYLYGSHDTMLTEYCGRDLVLWSASVNDLLNWRYEGVIFESRLDNNGNPLTKNGEGDILFAPDVVEIVTKDGKKKYYLYPNNQHDCRKSQVAVSDRPDGPFTVCNWNPSQPGHADGPLAFDPAVFVDDDGRVYGYWGFGWSNGAELDSNTMSTLKHGTEIKNLLTSYDKPGKDRFYEASSMRKIGDKYILIYSRMTEDGEFGLPASNFTLAYAYSDAPLGPFKYGGTLIDGRARRTRSDGTVEITGAPGGNTHGSLVKIVDQWYVFYHRQTGLDEFARQPMVAPVEISITPGAGGKVSITEGEVTSEGFRTEGLSLEGSYAAGIACHFTGPTASLHNWPNFQYSGSYPNPTYFMGDYANPPSDVSIRANPMVNNTAGSVIGYKYFNFDNLKRDSITLSMDIVPQGPEGHVSVVAGAPSIEEGGILLGNIEIPATTHRKRLRVSTGLSGLKSLTGKQPLYFRFDSSLSHVSICDFLSFSFHQN